MKPINTALVAVLLMAALLPVGCARNEATTDQGMPPVESSDGAVGTPETLGEPKSDPGVGATFGGSGDEGAPQAAGDAYRSGTTAGVDRMVVRNSSLELRVEDVDSAVEKLRAAVRAHGGEIAELSVSGGNGGIPVDEMVASNAGPTYAYIIVRAPAAKLDALSDALGELGTVVSQSESSSDVTEQAIDMEARLKNLRAEEARLRSFLDRTNKVSELLAVEAELARVRGEIESMDAQLTYLKRQVEKATLSVTLSEPGSVTGPESPWYRLRQAFSRGVQGAITVVETLITLIVGALPLLILAAGLAWALIAGLRRRYRRNLAEAARTSVDDETEDQSASSQDLEE